MITHVKFVSVPVSDQERALKFYTEKLGFEFLDGPITPKPERIPGASRPKRARRKSSKPKGGSGSPPPGRGALPKVPLVRV